jgi:hypothetical protein
MKGNARKMGKPPPEEPPTPAAEALAADIGDIGAFRSGVEGLVVQRGAGFAWRSSRSALIGAPAPESPELAVVPEAYVPSRPDAKLEVPRRAVGRPPISKVAASPAAGRAGGFARTMDALPVSFATGTSPITSIWIPPLVITWPASCGTSGALTVAEGIPTRIGGIVMPIAGIVMLIGGAEPIVGVVTVTAGSAIAGSDTGAEIAMFVCVTAPSSPGLEIRIDTFVFDC